jgi:hypothetical protein
VFVELIEALRCPRDHAESPLVVTASRTDARHVMEGILGCPICHEEFAIRNGEALFDGDGHAAVAAPSAETAVRLAAFLDLTDARTFAILCGSWAAHAEEVRVISDTPLLLVNPPRGLDVSGTGIVRVRGRLPVAPSSARAAALDASDDAELVASTVAAVRPNGRLVGPMRLSLPEGVREVTRDAQMWIAEKEVLHGIAGRISRAR